MEQPFSSLLSSSYLEMNITIKLAENCVKETRVLCKFASSLVPFVSNNDPLSIKEETCGIEVNAYFAWRSAKGVEKVYSISQGKRIHVSWLTSIIKVSTNGLPAGLA